MREYAKVTPCFWTGRTGRGLRKDPDAQITALYLMTSQHANMLGLYYCPVAYIVADTGLTEEGAYKALLFKVYSKGSKSSKYRRMDPVRWVQIAVLELHEIDEPPLLPSVNFDHRSAHFFKRFLLVQFKAKSTARNV